MAETSLALTAAAVRRALREVAEPARAANLAWFFKTERGGYGEGDRFIGVTVPTQRGIARRFRALPLDHIDKLLTSPIHEQRLVALLILVDQFARTPDSSLKSRIFRLYTRRLRFINNWDLVDTSAPPIVGGWLADKRRGLLDRYARSPRLWTRRVAMLATLYFIVRGEHRDAIRIATILVHDREDLMHKAVGWMLRETGKRASAPALERFLSQHAATMPRTMLRYAIERLPAAERRHWMAARVRRVARNRTSTR